MIVSFIISVVGIEFCNEDEDFNKSDEESESFSNSELACPLIEWLMDG